MTNEPIYPLIHYQHLMIDTGRPVVFLDMDGVMNGGWQHEYYRDELLSLKVYRPPRKGDWLCAHRLKLMQWVLRKHNAQVVLISCWVSSMQTAYDPEIRELNQLLEFPSLIGSLACGSSRVRGDAILACVRQTQLENWVVIDDCGHWYREIPGFPEAHLLDTNGRFGLSDRDFAWLDAFLGQQHDRLNRDHPALL